MSVQECKSINDNESDGVIRPQYHICIHTCMYMYIYAYCRRYYNHMYAYSPARLVYAASKILYFLIVHVHVLISKGLLISNSISYENPILLYTNLALPRSHIICSVSYRISVMGVACMHGNPKFWGGEQIQGIL